MATYTVIINEQSELLRNMLKSLALAGAEVHPVRQKSEDEFLKKIAKAGREAKKIASGEKKGIPFEELFE